MFEISREGPLDGGSIESLLDTAFGAERHARPSYSLRDGLKALGELCFVARRGATVAGTIRFWPLAIPGAQSALLLGPIAVDPAHGNLGIGSALIEHGLSAARARGHDAVAAIGEARYLARFGFRPAHEFALEFPAPVAPDRFHALALLAGALNGGGGMVGRVS
ncbi:MAG: N-acetyltransferase [Alphaproteobacteria bacterium]|jgi:predicted N-acetyltransferase YhbS|nr:N-acetyltransferase [Alphaproteobacteria bacterium]MDP6589993.1 N-acetyltransferase [Alphaproteobacteria bacterium]MDP6819665.1 N-acetyltransferase [Alphaproteobacteria bacterium]